MDSTGSLDEIARKTSQTSSFKEVVSRLNSGEKQVHLQGLPDTLFAFLLTHVQRSIRKPMLVVASDEDTAERWRDDLQAIAGEEIVKYFPAWDINLFESRSPDPEITELRIVTATSLLDGEPTIVVAPIEALVTPLIPAHALDLGTVRLKVEAEHPLEDLTALLADCGFERVSMIDAIGQYSVRGGILDIYPFGADNPFRLEFFGDEIESIRTFDVATQRSVSTCREALIPPAREVLLMSPLFEDYLERIDAVRGSANGELNILRDQLELGASLEGIESYMSVLYDLGNGLFDYLDEPLVFAPDGEELNSAVKQVLEKARKEHQRRSFEHPFDGYLPPASWLPQQLSRFQTLRWGGGDTAVRFGAENPRAVEGELGLLRHEIDRLHEDDYAIHIRCETQAQNSRLQELFADWSDHISYGLGTLQKGFVFPEAKLALLNDHEIFSRQKRRYRYRKFKAAIPLSTFKALQRGDFVVHVDYGIGRFAGIQRLSIGGLVHDCLQVSYQGSDKLFVPVEQLDRLRKYSGAEADPPLLSKLGGTAWEKLKERTREEIFKMAAELAQLYAERQARSGFRFSADGPLQRELEASFPFQETPDQLRTMEEVSRDMESGSPMDRLVCGDVGYGKTEVAIRAAFKAVCDGKQVAILVPTTILAEQHFQTFTERMVHVPAKVEVMSRFRTAKEQKEIIAKVKSGNVDILIGTHRILSKDIGFRDLGLLVVDEEQRFGVRHKERLKQMKRLVDVLTLTATPIPRTLHMSLMGSRDMSVINTPPQDRLPIHTEIISFDENRIAAAILREVERQGQVYFVHNRVQSIYRLQDFLTELVPQVRFGVAHGQMPPRQLEKIMFDFLERKYDCLVCTMIIESGIDIPSVNTILVNRSDALGLSQLYQIRGRVGRSKERAFAYLLVPKGKKLTKESRMRLRAIEEFADLGSGFNIAMRDMEIRGAGNLLGAQQHGFIAAVGFDLYCRLLEEAMRELKGEEVVVEIEPEIKIGVSAYIPDDYIPDGDQKMEFYQRLANARKVVELLGIREEMEDRFGRPSIHAQALLHTMEIKVMARQLGLAAVYLEKSSFRLYFPEGREPAPAAIEHLVGKSTSQLEFKMGDRLCIEIDVGGRDQQERLEKARNAIQELL